jgi:hypothetical protein
MPHILLSDLMGLCVDIEAGPPVFATAGVWSRWMMLWLCRHFTAALEDLMILGLYARSQTRMRGKLGVDTTNEGERYQLWALLGQGYRRR